VGGVVPAFDTRRQERNADSATSAAATTVSHGTSVAMTATARPVVALVSMIRSTYPRPTIGGTSGSPRPVRRVRCGFSTE